MKTMFLATLVALSACAGTAPKVTAMQQGQIVSQYLTGASSAEIADQLHVGRNDARRLIRKTIQDLYRMYAQNR